MPASSSSSEDDGLDVFAAVTVSAADLQAHAERSKQVAKERQARARARRAGGGGVLGAVPSGAADGATADPDASLFLDAAQLKVAEALQRRLQAELEDDPAPAAGVAAQPAPQQQQPGDESDGGGVRLFRRVKAGAPVVDRQRQQQEQQEWQAKDGGRCAGTVAEVRHLEEPTKARCRAAAVDAANLLAAADAAAQQARQHIAAPLGWLPADDDPCRWSHRRKRRAAKLAAEAAAWQSRSVA
ncbi:hypothetical protein C2E20_3356 [Micractinium conductrix]|uniref:Uncharacterized protein n=1 Tax=Micractinium conductrix TaxID=554055 RepID=A0A2P6VHC2_9CHLO|nr:hypothetical protein C2E20_3356 [Micractinium conductrix]|eukprot:PSC73491.1 hypothetical protein C2E20_3356 [Micractinium conductrix]